MGGEVHSTNALGMLTLTKEIMQMKEPHRTLVDASPDDKILIKRTVDECTPRSCLSQ